MDYNDGRFIWRGFRPPVLNGIGGLNYGYGITKRPLFNNDNESFNKLETI